MKEQSVSEMFLRIKEDILKESLNRGFVIFFYRKADGTKRKAIGTRDVSVIQAISSWRPTGAKENTSSLCYFDLAKLAWRSMRHGNLIDIAVADFDKDWTECERYLVSQAFAAHEAIGEAIANGEAGNVMHLVDVLTNNPIWGVSDEFVLKSRYAKVKRVIIDKTRDYSSLKEKYNKLVDDFNSLVKRHDEVVLENIMNIRLLRNIEDSLKDEVLKVYPLDNRHIEKV